MALSQSILSAALAGMTPTLVPASAVAKLAASYSAFMQDAVTNSIPLTNPASAQTAMTGAMSFPVPGTAASASSVIVAGVIEFWATMTASPPTFFAASAVITPPPGIAGMGTALAAVFVANIGLSLADSADAMASVIASASMGGTATFPGPVSFPIT